MPAMISIVALALASLSAAAAQSMNYTSPVVYPSPQGTGTGNWAAAYQKAQALVTQMTLEEMNNLTIGFTATETGCVGTSGGAPRVGFPGFCLQDAGNGVRGVDGVNGYASGVHVGATWNSDLAYTRGQFMGAEFKTKGVNVALGPVIAPLGRVAEGGRNWEGFAADPYLNGILGAETVKGLQQSVISSVKHYIAYEQETNRNPTTNQSSTSANVDDQTIHEVYLWPFQDLVNAGAACVMCSYNRINNTYACENSKTMNGILKGELDFQGFVVSDWFGQHSGLSSANAGLDMAMPFSSYWNNSALADSVNNGTFNKTRLTDMATRIVAAWYQLGQDSPSYPPLGVGMPSDLNQPHAFVNARDPAAQPSILQQAVEGHVLVKNNGSLPLKSPQVLSIIGYDAMLPQLDLPNAAALTTNGEAPEARIGNGTQVVGGGSGANTPPYIISPADAIQQRAYTDGTSVYFDFHNLNPSIVGSSDACLVFINEYSTEGSDRLGLADPSSDTIVQNTAAQCNNTIVVIHNAGIRVVDAWIENPNITAVIFAHLPGQDSGYALTQVLYGDASPSGRLPYTVAKQASDYGSLLGPCNDTSESPECDFAEGVEIDYRSFLARNITPRYEFGYGLTYSSFSYSDLNIQVGSNAASTSSSSSNGTTSMADLYSTVGTITATITNTGAITAAEVAQLYLQLPNAQTRTLRGFQKETIPRGASAQVSFSLRRKDVSTWDVTAQQWVVPSEMFQVFVGKSVLDIPLTGAFSM